MNRFSAAAIAERSSKKCNPFTDRDSRKSLLIKNLLKTVVTMREAPNSLRPFCAWEDGSRCGAAE